MRVSIVIPVFNKWELTEQCLRSLALHHSDIPCEIIVVDNNSEDMTSAACPVLGQNLFGENFIFLRQPQNRNFAGACNIGAKTAKGEYIFFLNNDTLVTPNWLEPLLETFNNQQNVAAVGPLLLYPHFGGQKDRVQHVGVAITPFIQVLHLYEGFPADHKAITRPRMAQVITAAAILIPRALFLGEGGFNESYLNGLEDVDLCARLWSKGYGMFVEPKSHIYHLQSQTPGRYKHEAENSILLCNTSLSLLAPDLHLHLKQDGFELGLSNWLAFYPKLPDQTTIALSSRFLRDGNEEQVAALLQQEPLWYEGYDWLAAQLESRDEWEKAFGWRVLAARLKADPDTMLPLLQAAIKTGQHREIKHAFSNINRTPFIADFFVCSAKKIRQWGLDCGIEALTALCDSWLEKQDRFRSEVLHPAIVRLKKMGLLRQSLCNRSDLAYLCTLELQNEEQIDIMVDKMLKNLPRNPLLSILMPVYNPDPDHLEAAILSVREQNYTEWELCIADDASTNPQVHAILEQHAAQDSRIKIAWRKKNGDICATSNSALELASGEYVALLCQDDLLAQHSLVIVASAIVANPDAMLLYSDEDKMTDSQTRSSVYHKPDFDPDLLCGQNYFRHLGIYKTELVRTVNGFREEFEGTQDHDLILRCMEKVKPEQVIHLPQVLYHYRINQKSANVSNKPYARQNGLRAVAEHLERTGRKASVSELTECGYYRVRESMPTRLPIVSLIVKAFEDADASQRWSQALLQQTSYPHVELILIHNSSNFETQAADSRIRHIYEAQTFKVNLDQALAAAAGTVIGHIQAGLLPYSDNWLEQLVAGLTRPEVGAIGGRIFTANEVLESAGLGITKEGQIFPCFAGVRRNDDPGYYYQHGLLRNVLFNAATSLFARADNFRSYYDTESGWLWYAEFCMRARQDKLRVLCTPLSDLYHHQDFPQSQATQADATLLKAFAEKWSSQLMREALHPALAPVSGGYTMAGINKR